MLKLGAEVGVIDGGIVGLGGSVNNRGVDNGKAVGVTASEVESGVSVGKTEFTWFARKLNDEVINAIIARNILIS